MTICSLAKAVSKTHDDLLRLALAGISSFLVGESLMLEADVTQATQRLLGLAA